MSEDMRQEDQKIGEEAEAAARADLERHSESEIPRIGYQVLGSQLLAPMAGTLGLTSDKIPAEVSDSMRRLREDLSDRKPPPLEESHVPPSFIEPTEE